MFTPKIRLAWIASCVLLRVFRQTNSIGGSSDSDDTALAVAPKSAPPLRVVRTVTPLAKWPMTWRKVSLLVGLSVCVTLTHFRQAPWAGCPSMPRRFLAGQGVFSFNGNAAGTAAVPAESRRHGRFPFDGKDRCASGSPVSIVRVSHLRPRREAGGASPASRLRHCHPRQAPA